MANFWPGITKTRNQANNNSLTDLLGNNTGNSNNIINNNPAPVNPQTSPQQRDIFTQRVGDGTFISVPKRDPEPEALTDLRKQLSDIAKQGLGNFNNDNWQQAQNLTNQALAQQGKLLGQSSDIVQQILNIAQNGTLPSNLINAMNASVNQGLQSSMGNMLNNLANRGILNSSVTTAGTNQLSQAAADAFNRNYLTAYQSALGGLGQGLQSTLSALSAAGSAPSQAYNSIGAGLTIPYNFWKDWQNFYQSDDPYESIYVQDTPKQKSGCLTGDTLVTLEDGHEIPVRELKDNDRLRVWDFESGRISSAPLAAFVKRTNADGFDVIRVEFEDGSSVGVVLGHLFFDITLGKFVEINADNQDFVGQEFAKVIDGKAVPVKVTAIHTDGREKECYAPQAEGSWNYITEGFITGNEGQLAICNMFYFDGLRWDAKKRAKDLAQFGLLDYDVFNGIISKRVFDANHAEELSVAFGKGLADCEEFRAYLKKYSDDIFGKEGA